MNVNKEKPRKNRAVFLDRDGTICFERGYIARPEDLELIPGAASAIKAINCSSMLAVLVTNQSGVARGILTREGVERVNKRLRELLSHEGAVLDGIYFCPHLSGAPLKEYDLDCPCRKPNPGMLLKAASDMSIDLSSSYGVGDKLGDVEATKRAGATGILVLTGYGRSEVARVRSEELPSYSIPDHVASDLKAAVEWILSRESGGIRY